MAMSEIERRILTKLSQAGAPIELEPDDLAIARLLEAKGLALVVRNTTAAVITPNGRHVLTQGEGSPLPPKKPPFGFLRSS